MVEKLKSTVNIPVWLVTMLIPLIISLFIFIIDKTEDQVKIQSQTLTEISNIKERIDRIETKLDTHIIND